MTTSPNPTVAATATRKPQARGVKRARSLLDVAAALFVKKGIDETTIDDIVAQAGIAKGTFYHHYESKAALLTAIRATTLDDFQAHIDAALADCPEDDLPLRLDTWVKAACGAYIRLIPLYDIAFAGEGWRWTPRDTDHFRHLVALLNKGNHEGCWAVKYPDTAAIHIHRGLFGVIDDLVVTGRDPWRALSDVVEITRSTVSLMTSHK